MPTIYVKGAIAELHGISTRCLDACLTVLDPKRFFNQAYKDDRWDGKVYLHDGRTFAAGLVQHVVKHIVSTGKEVKVVEQAEKKGIDTSRMTRDYLPAVGSLKEFWEPQYEAIITMLENTRGIIRSVTGSGKTEIMCAVARYLWEERDWRTVVIVPKAGLLVQTVRRFERYYQGDIEVGMLGDGVKRYDCPITIGTAQTLISYRPRMRKTRRLPADRKIRDMLLAYEVLILDECLTGDAEVATPEGSIAIGDPEILSKRVFAFDALSGTLSARRVLRWLKRGLKQVYAVRLRSGEVVKATERTPFWTPGGWVMLKDLQVGDAVTTAGAAVGLGCRRTREGGNENIFSATSVSALVSTGRSVWHGSPWTDLCARVGAVSDLTFHPPRTCCTNFCDIVEITDLGMQETFDIEVEGLHSFVANGIVVHNCHHASATGWYDIAMFSKAIRRYGLSGTPLKHSDIADMRMIGATGPILYDCDAKTMIALDLAAKPKIAMIMSDKVSGEELPWEWGTYTNPRTGVSKPTKKLLPYADAYVKGVVECEPYNRAVVRAAVWLVDKKKQTLVLCRRKAHWLRLKTLLEASGIQVRAVWGDTATPEREVVKKEFGERSINLILASTIFDEGEDVPTIEAVVLAEGVKISTNVLQRIGRGMRRKETGANEVWIVDFVPTCHAKLIEHAQARAKAYEKEGHEVVLVEDWPNDDEGKHLLPFLDWEKAYGE